MITRQQWERRFKDSTELDIEAGEDCAAFVWDCAVEIADPGDDVIDYEGTVEDAIEALFEDGAMTVRMADVVRMVR